MKRQLATPFLAILALFSVMALGQQSAHAAPKNKAVTILYATWFDKVTENDAITPGHCVSATTTSDRACSVDTQCGFGEVCQRFSCRLDADPAYLSCPIPQAATHLCPPAAWHWWGTPAIVDSELGGDRLAYTNSNNIVTDRHAQQLTSAGIDFITIDYSNGNVRQEYFNSATRSVLKRFHQLRTGTGTTKRPAPLVAFYLDGGSLDAVACNFYGQTQYCETPADVENAGKAYFPGNYFKVAGKPLLLMIAGAERCQTDPTLASLFTCRNMGVHHDTSTPIWWNTLNGPWTTKDARQTVAYRSLWPEEISTCPIAYPPEYAPTSCDPNVVSRASGNTFNAQWKKVSESNPTFVFVTSWNEWVNQNFPQDACSKDPLRQCNSDADCGTTLGTCIPQAAVRFTDQWTPNLSADIEPMRGGHGSSYLSLLTQNVARYKKNVPNFSFRDGSNGRWYLKYYNGAKDLDGSNYATTFDWAPGTHYQPLVADFNRDGFEDIGLWDGGGGGGFWHLKLRNAAHSFYLETSTAWWANTSTHTYQPMVADVNGDSFVDIILRHIQSGTWYVRYGTATFGTFSAPAVLFAWPAPGAHYQPFIGHFNTDSALDLGVRDSTTGMWHVAERCGATYCSNAAFMWTNTVGASYTPFVGDFDGDGRTDIGLRQSVSPGAVMIVNGTAANYSFNFADVDRYVPFTDSLGSARPVPYPTLSSYQFAMPPERRGPWTCSDAASCCGPVCP